MLQPGSTPYIPPARSIRQAVQLRAPSTVVLCSRWVWVYIWHTRREIDPSPVSADFQPRAAGFQEARRCNDGLATHATQLPRLLVLQRTILQLLRQRGHPLVRDLPHLHDTSIFGTCYRFTWPNWRVVAAYCMFSGAGDQ